VLRGIIDEDEQPDGAKKQALARTK
jgi:hypothetical protein